MINRYPGAWVDEVVTRSSKKQHVLLLSQQTSVRLDLYSQLIEEVWAATKPLIEQEYPIQPDFSLTTAWQHFLASEQTLVRPPNV
jgi:hypothetical protein